MDVGDFVWLVPDKANQIYDACGDLKLETVEACISAFNYCGFHNQNQFDWLGYISPRRPVS